MNKTQRLARFMWFSRPLMQRVEEMVRDGLEGSGLTVRMRAVLEVLDAKGALSVPDIGRELHIQRQYVQKMVNEVITAGLAEKQPNPKHRSSPLIALTPRGGAVIRDVLEMEHSKAERLAERFSDEEVEIALRVASRLCEEIPRRDR
ncbi:MAG: MarR family winged helix-turn-helix transcriptional regulator [Paracoccaceae bacterium]